MTPAWAVMGCAPAGYEHGGQSSMGPPTFPDQARGKPDPGSTQGVQSGGNGSRARAELYTRLQHGSKAHPGDRAKEDWRQTTG